ncbi:MAG: hypothetical protein IMZ47_01455 [Firmicutes bacterium]|nr:hypothetical protein [Bacillota bacterium]
MKKKPLGKMMTEFSHELGITTTKKNKTGKRMLMAAGGVLGFSLIKGMMNRMK